MKNIKKRVISFLLVICIVVICCPLTSSASGKHTVTSATLSNGTITFNKSAASEGETVIATIKPDSGYVTRAGSVFYTYQDGGTVTKALINHVVGEGNGEQMQFTMPDTNVVVYAEFINGDTNGFSFDIVGAAVKSYGGTFESGTFNGLRFLSRLYFPAGSHAASTGKIKVKKGGTRTEIAEIGILYAKTSSFGTETEMTVENVGTNGIRQSVSFTSASPLDDHFFDSTKTFVDTVAEINSTTNLSLTDYTARAYVKFVGGDIFYSAERTDFAENTAKRLDLCEVNGGAADVTLTVSNATPVNSGFDGFGAVIYPWTSTCVENGVVSAAAKAKAYTELDRMQAAGIDKVRIIFATIPPAYYDFTNKVANVSADWYTNLWIEMLNALDDRGIEAMINFCWGDSIQTLSGGYLTAVMPSSYSELTLNEQITAYGQLSAAFVDFFLDNGCDNVTKITFYSEPGNGWKGNNNAEAKSQSAQLNFGNVITTYGQCVASVKQQLNALGRGNDVQLVSGNISMIYDPSSGYDWWNITSWGGYSFLSGKNWFRTMLGKSNITSNSNAYSYHYYGKYNNVKISNYTANKTALDGIKNTALNGTGISTNSIMMDELSVKITGSGAAANNKSTVSAFEATQLAEYLATVMNSGYKGAYLWSFSDFGGDNNFGFMPNAKSSASLPYSRYYAMALVARYMNSCNSIYAGSQSNGCVSTFGTDSQGHKTLLVVNMNTENKTVTVNFGSSLSGTTLKRHIYNPSFNPITEQANPIGADKTFTGVSSSLTDTLPAGCVAIYTSAD